MDKTIKNIIKQTMQLIKLRNYKTTDAITGLTKPHNYAIRLVKDINGIKYSMRLIKDIYLMKHATS